MDKELFIKNITIENFQSHSYTSLDLDKNVNVIIGPSDSGKTAVIRALKWVFFNEPSGTDIIKKGESEAKVTVNLSNDFTIVRGRGKSKNYYEIISPNGDLERYEGFGVNVPEEVLEISGIDKIDLGNNNKLSLNLAEQLESPFLITDSPSVKANAVGKLAGVDKIDKALNKLSKDIYEVNFEKRSLEKELDNQKKLLEEFSFLKEEKEKIDRLQIIFNRTEELQLQVSQMNKLKENFEQIQNKTKIAKASIKKFENLGTIEQLYQGLSIKYDSLKILSNLNKRFSYTTSKMDELKTFLTKIDIKSLEELYEEISLKSKDLLKFKELKGKSDYLNNKIDLLKNKINEYREIDNLELKNKELEKLIERRRKLQELNNKLQKLYEQEGKLLNYLKNLELKYKKAVDFYIDLLKVSGTCPFCYNKIDDEHISWILKELEV